jgi:archaetidylinositol phosphate synthase
MTISTDQLPARLSAGARKAGPGRELAADGFRALAEPLVALLQRLRVPPPAIVLVHTAIGVGAAVSILAGALVAGALLLQLKTLLDNADGQLARASGQVSALGRYLDTEADLVVNASVLAALGSVTGAPWLTVAAFCAVTLVLSANHNVPVLYDEARGKRGQLPPAAGSTIERALAGGYAFVFAPQDRLVRALLERRLASIVHEERDPIRRERATLAYHDRATVLVLANLGLSTQLLAAGICLVLGAPVAYLWLAVASLALLSFLQLRRELLVRRALAGPRLAGSGRSA